jgi:hypothetical protein
MCLRERGAIVFILVTVIALGFLGFCLYALSRAMNSMVDTVQDRVPAASTSDAPFIQTWSVRLSPPLVHEMALTPGRPGHFLALNNDEILQFDSTGARESNFAAPPKSSRIATDPSSGMPHVMVVSSTSKWTGAIDHTVTTDHFLHALDTGGREIWKRRFDPSAVATLEAVFTSVMGTPVVLLSASRRIFCFDVSGRQLWELPIWHHPGTLTATDSDGGTILAAAAPKQEIVRIGADGTVLGPWGMGDAPRRFRAMQTRAGLHGISVRQLFGRGAGVRQALAFFDGGGMVIREVQLPADAALLTYAPIAAMDVDGSGHRNWVVALGDGTILVYSPLGERLAEHMAGSRLRTLLAVPQREGPDLLVVATPGGLTAWRPVPGRMQPPR